MNHLHQKSVLALNRHWLPVSVITVADAFCHMVAGTAHGIHITDDNMVALAWKDWSALPVSETSSIGTKNGRIRIPSVIVLTRYGGVPLYRPSLGFRALWDRDGGRCQYSGRKLTPEEADIDHIIPRSRGGKDTWENCVISDRSINRRKAARTPSEARLTLIRRPRAPRVVPISATITNTQQINEWKYFIMK